MDQKEKIMNKKWKLSNMTPQEALAEIIRTGPNEILLNIIKTDPPCAFNYAVNVIRGRWPEAEEYIKHDAEHAFYYARCVINNRWPEAEEYIKKNAEYARRYAERVIRGRWLEAESVIITEPIQAYFYAIELIGRWPEAEKYIVEIDYPNVFYYLQHFVKGRWVELEQVLLKNKNQRAIVRYCKIINQRWPEAESLLGHNLLVDYCNHFSIPLPEENYNKELLDCAINAKSSRYFNKIKKEKEAVVRLLKSLVSRQIISTDQTVEDLIK